MPIAQGILPYFHLSFMTVPSPQPDRRQTISPLGTSEKTQVWRVIDGRAGRMRPPESHSHRQEKRQVMGGIPWRAGGAGRTPPRGERAPAQPDEAEHNMTHSPEPRPCVSAAGEREPARGPGRGSRSPLQPCSGGAREAGTCPRTPGPTHSAGSRAAPAASVPPAARGAAQGGTGAGAGGVRCVRGLSQVARQSLGSATAAGAGLTAPAGEGRPAEPSLPQAGPPHPAPPATPGSAAPEPTCSRQRRPRRRRAVPSERAPDPRPHTPLWRAARRACAASGRRRGALWGL